MGGSINKIISARSIGKKPISMKYMPDKFNLLNQVYERAFEFAASTDNDGVSMRIRPTGLNLG